MVSRKSWRWSAPAAVVVAIGAGVGINGALSADASPTLPHRSAEQLLVDMQKAQPVQLSGTVVQHADMGIPALPDMQGESSNLTSLIAGSHTLRVWYGGSDKARVALVGTLGESDVIHNGKDIWIWSSQKNEAQHLTLNQKKLDQKGAARQHAMPSELSELTPRQLADKLLSAVDPSTAVKSDGTVSVAGRDAYQVSISPRTKDSLIGSVRIAIDSKTSAPLRVEVFSRDNADDPALDAGFTYVDFSSPSASQFRFDPPKGVKVEQIHPERADVKAPDSGKRAQAPKTEQVGTGWKTVLVANGVKNVQKGQLQQYLNSLTPVSGSWGRGRLFESALLNALLTDDGRVIVGAVSPQVLYDAAGR